MIPVQKRRRCLFAQSCSQYVFQTTTENGVLSGIKALYNRWNHCRPGYFIIEGTQGKFMISAKNKIFNASEINQQILQHE